MSNIPGGICVHVFRKVKRVVKLVPPMVSLKNKNFWIVMEAISPRHYLLPILKSRQIVPSCLISC